MSGSTMRRRIGQEELEKERIAFPLTLHRFTHRYEFATIVELDDAADEPILRPVSTWRRCAAARR